MQSKVFIIHLSDYLTPWKVSTYLLGLLILILGSHFFIFDDWDIGVSIIMSILAYVFAPLSVKLIISAQNKTSLQKCYRYLLSLFLTWLVIDGSYWLYWSVVNKDSLYMRQYQWPLSLYLYAMCGLLWFVPGSFKNTIDTYKSYFQKFKKKFQ